jgi:hypothetical protein
MARIYSRLLVVAYVSRMMVEIKNTSFDVTHIRELERLMYFLALKCSKGYMDGGG